MSGRLLLGFLEALVYFRPVHHIPPRGQVVRALVLILQVVGMLPHVVAKNRIDSLAQWRVLVGRGNHLQLAALEYQPAPPGPELLRSRLIERLLERLKVAEILLDLVR